MSVKKLVAIGLIFVGAFIAWMVLGVNDLSRTQDLSSSLGREVQNLYGSAQVVVQPKVYYLQTKTEVSEVDGKVVKKENEQEVLIPFESGQVQADLKLDHRKKGVLWFTTYQAHFTSRYTFSNAASQAHALQFFASLSTGDAMYDQVRLVVNGVEQKDIQPLVQGKGMLLKLPEEGTSTVELSYDTTGMDSWQYYFRPEQQNVAELRQFQLTVLTNFKAIDFPAGSISPTDKEETPGGWKLTWRYERTLTGKSIGLVLPARLNPGDIVSRVTFFAPVPLLFYFFLLVILAVLFKVNIHPMNYLFLAGGFFAFHLIFSYFSDHLNIYWTFALAAGVSLALNASYLKLFVPARFAFGYSALAQLVYLVLFSFSFFYKGITGMILTVVSVLTLYLLMQLTGKVDWNVVFAKPGALGKGRK